MDLFILLLKILFSLKLYRNITKYTLKISSYQNLIFVLSTNVLENLENQLFKHYLH